MFLRNSLILLFMLLVCSCVSKKEIIYFQDLDHSKKQLFNQDFYLNTPVFESFDKLSIIVNSLKYGDKQEKDLTAKYNLENSLSTTPKSPLVYYDVDKDGNIIIPVIGTYKIAGKRKYEVIEELKQIIFDSICTELKPSERNLSEGGSIDNEDLVTKDNIIINIQHQNFRVNILGEVAKPGVYTITNDKISIMEAIAMANDLTIQGKRDNVKLIREKNDTIEIKYLNLNDANLLSSEYYYLKQNDIVYIEPNQSKIQSSQFNYTSFISVASILIALVSILLK